MGLIADLSDVERFFGVFRPEAEIAHSQEVLVVYQQLFQAGAGHVSQLDLRFL